jgi:hypothetical protein
MMYGACQYPMSRIYGNLLDFVCLNMVQCWQEVRMSEAPKSKTTVWIDQQDRDNMAAIKRVYRLASDSAAIRYALQRIAQEARVEERR